MKLQTDKGTVSNYHAVSEGLKQVCSNGRRPPKVPTWDYNATLQPSSEATRLPRSKDSRRQGSWVTAYVPAAGRPTPVNADAHVRPVTLSLYERTQIKRKMLKKGSGESRAYDCATQRQADCEAMKQGYRVARANRRSECDEMAQLRVKLAQSMAEEARLLNSARNAHIRASETTADAAGKRVTVKAAIEASQFDAMFNRDARRATLRSLRS